MKNSHFFLEKILEEAEAMFKAFRSLQLLSPPTLERNNLLPDRGPSVIPMETITRHFKRGLMHQVQEGDWSFLSLASVAKC